MTSSRVRSCFEFGRHLNILSNIKLYRIKEASEILGVHPKTIQRWAREGKIRVVKTVGGIRRIPESEIRRLLGEEVKRVDEVGEVRAVLYARVSSYDQEQHDDFEQVT